MSSTINTNGPWAFEFIWFIAVKSHDIHRESPLIPPSKYKLNACIKESSALKNRREQIWLSAYLVLPEVGHRNVRNFKQIIIFFYVILWYMYNVFFSKVSHLLCLVKKSSCRILYFSREISPWMLTLLSLRGKERTSLF